MGTARAVRRESTSQFERVWKELNIVHGELDEIKEDLAVVKQLRSRARIIGLMHKKPWFSWLFSRVSQGSLWAAVAPGYILTLDLGWTPHLGNVACKTTAGRCINCSFY